MLDAAMKTILPLAACLGLAAGLPAQGPSAKFLFDQNLGELRAAQLPDGSYGSRLDTARVLIGMSRSPRAYAVEDGPFIRDAVLFLTGTESAFEDAWGDAAVALALECLGSERFAATIAALCRRHDIPRAVLQEIARRGVPSEPLPEDADWAQGLPLPGEEEDAVSILGGLPEQASVSQRAEAVARAALAWRRDQAVQPPGADRRRIYERGVDFLVSQRSAAGLWEFQGRPEPGISALAARALLGSERPEIRASVEPVLDWLATLQKEDGAIYDQGLPVYVTSVAVRLFVAAGRPEDRPRIERAVAWLKAVQADEGEGYSEADKFYGGIGYGSDLRPDLSNLQFAMQAMAEAGVTAEDPAFQKSLRFLQRVQNRSESNPEIWKDPQTGLRMRAGDDGGAAYYPGNSPAGVIRLADGTAIARSYGSMTYALLKCYHFAGLDAEDPRMQAAVEWIQRHWTLEVNPGFDTLKDPRAGYQGLYYYYLTLAEALGTAGIDRIRTPDGIEHDWRAELAAELAERQRRDGSWLNEGAERWMEGNPVLCTAYALNALQALR